MELEETKKAAPEASLPMPELPADIPAEVRRKLAEDLSEEATEDLKQDCLLYTSPSPRDS